MKDLRLKIVDSTGHTIVSSLTDACSGCLKTSGIYERTCPTGKGMRRVGKKRDANGRDFFVCMQASGKQHQFDIAMSTLVEAFTIFASHSTEAEGEKVKRLIHDVEGVLGRSHFFALIPQNQLMDTKYQDQFKVIQEIQRKEPDKICKTLIYLHKDNQIMTHLFNVYRILDCNDMRSFKKLNWKIHGLLLNVLYLWNDDFDAKNIKVHVDPSAPVDIKVECDFDTIQAALILFLDNAQKYAQKNHQ